MKYIYNDQIGFVEFVDSMGSDSTVVQAARVSFNKDEFKTELDQRDVKLVNYLAAHNHTSPFEHISATFRIKVPLFVRSQIMRHRTFSYNEISRRYTSELIECFRPDELRSQSKKDLQCSSGVLNDDYAINVFKASISSSLTAYAQLINRGVARELARCVLPQSLYTSFYMSGNLNNWFKFLKLRLDSHAQPEIIKVAEVIRDELKERFPVSMDALMKDIIL